MSRFPDAVRAAAEELSQAPPDTSAAHVHFDDPAFSGLVPPFTDREWIDLAGTAATAASGVRAPLLVSVPLGEWDTRPEAVDVESLRQLAPWEPPAIYLLSQGSAYEARVRRGAWHSDDVPAAAGAVGWLSGHLDDESGRWRLSLFYETAANLG